MAIKLSKPMPRKSQKKGPYREKSKDEELYNQQSVTNDIVGGAIMHGEDNINEEMYDEPEATVGDETTKGTQDVGDNNGHTNRGNGMGEEDDALNKEDSDQGMYDDVHGIFALKVIKGTQNVCDYYLKGTYRE